MSNYSSLLFSLCDSELSKPISFINILLLSIFLNTWYSQHPSVGPDLCFFKCPIQLSRVHCHIGEVQYSFFFGVIKSVFIGKVISIFIETNEKIQNKMLISLEYQSTYSTNILFRCYFIDVMKMGTSIRKNI